VFYFQQLLQTALNGIDTAKRYGRCARCRRDDSSLEFLYSAYQAFASGGDVRMLAISGIKYLILGLYSPTMARCFATSNGMFNSVANSFTNSTGVGDLFANWMNQLAQYWQANGNTSLWNLVTGLASGVISLILILTRLSYFLFAISSLPSSMRCMARCST